MLVSTLAIVVLHSAPPGLRTSILVEAFRLLTTLPWHFPADYRISYTSPWEVTVPCTGDKPASYSLSLIM